MSLLASAATTTGGGGLNTLLLLLPLLLLAFLFFSQRRRQKRMEQMQSELQVGTRVMTTTGLYGTVAGLDDKSVHIEAAPGVVLEWDRRAVIVAPGAQPPQAQPGPDDAAESQ